MREEIRGDLWKKRENELTRALLAESRDKYQVKFDEERLAALDTNGAEDTFTDAPVITSTRQNVSEKEFMVIYRRLMGNRPEFAHSAEDEEQAEKLKLDTAYNIIGQAVTNWAAEDRHFEKEEPFKWEYEFNYNHRLKLELERRLFSPNVKVTEDEIKQHYEENIGLYKQPAIVKLYIIDETQGPIDQIWAEVAVGKNFRQVLKEHEEDFELSPIPHETPVNHLDPEVMEVANNLVDGETSQIFTAQGIKVMVHMVERTPEEPLPLERVKEPIRATLKRKKFRELRDEYLDTLRSGSDIKVKNRKWQKIQKELGGA